MKILKKTLCLVLCFVMAMSFCVTVGAADMTQEEWFEMWDHYDENIAPGVTMFVGSDESERYIAWYSDSAEGYVELESGGKTEKIQAESKVSADGGYRLGVHLTDLKENEYSYSCHSGDFESETYTFTVENAETFTALYVSDIHMEIEEENENSLKERSFNYNRTLTAAENQAKENGGNLDLIVSGGDQASGGYTEELVALSTPELTKILPFATSVGNHDRKSVGYKYYTYLPNEADSTFKSYISTDYWYRYGNALFLMFDSCNTSMRDHYKFAKNATQANEDAVWVIAVMHHDMFGGREPWLNTENKLLRFLWTPLFDEYGVDLCLYGHSHYYSVSNVIYNNKTATALENVSQVKDPAGTVYMSSGSVNNLSSLYDDEGNVPPVGENAAFTYLEEKEPLYTLLDFTDESLTIRSYTVDDGENFYSLKIDKTDKKGGHTYKNTNFLLKGFTCFASRIVNIINNVDMYNRYKDQGYEVSLFEGLIGS